MSEDVRIGGGSVPLDSCGLWATDLGRQVLAEARARQACEDSARCKPEPEPQPLGWVGEAQPVGTDGARCEMLEWPLAALLRHSAGFDRPRATIEAELQDAIQYMTDDQVTVLQKIAEVLLGWG